MKSKEKMEIAKGKEQEEMVNLEDEMKYELIDGRIYGYGDINGDSKITNADVTRLNAFLGGKIELAQKEKVAADIDGNGEITTGDLELIKQYYAKQLTKFPIEEYVYGDTNGDGKVANSDITRLNVFLGGNLELTPKQKLAADVDGNGEITTEDLELIKQYYGGKLTKFPIEEFLYGDINTDEKITNADITRLRAYLLGKIDLTPKQKLSADVNGDGKITPEDTDLISKYYAQKITKFPVEEN